MAICLGAIFAEETEMDRIMDSHAQDIQSRKDSDARYARQLSEQSSAS